MDSLCAAPAVYSSMEAEDLADLSGDDEDEGDLDEDDEDGLDAMDDEGVNLRDLHLRSRFGKWLSQLPPGSAGRNELLLELFGLLEVSRHELEAVSSERRFSLSFTLASMDGHYEQYSQADIHSSVWDASEGKFVLRPNVEAKLALDDEILASCTHFVATLPDATESTSGSGSEKPSPWVDKARLSDRFGSDTLAKLGGLGILLEFLGTICVDAGTGCYAGALPFGLSSSLFEVYGSGEDIPRSPVGQRSKGEKKSKAGASKPIAPPAKAASQPVKPVASISKAAVPPRPPAATAAKASVAPTGPVSKASATGPAVVTLGLGGSASSMAAPSAAAASPLAAADLGGPSAAYPASNTTAPADPPVAPAALSVAPAETATPAAAKAAEAPHPAPPGRPNSRQARPRPSAKPSSVADPGPSSPKAARPASPKAGAASPKAARPASPKAAAPAPSPKAAASPKAGASPKKPAQHRNSSRGGGSRGPGRRSAGGSG